MLFFHLFYKPCFFFWHYTISRNLFFWNFYFAGFRSKLAGLGTSESSRGSSKKSGSKKLSASAALQQIREGNLDLESPDSILGQVNLRLLLNKSTFLKLPPLYQFKLCQLLPPVDNVINTKKNVVR